MEEGKKYIHYCWFGGRPLPKLARKCLESWKKYLPDYEIICWNEKNCDFNECEFVRKAFESKYYAFVADYFRTKALYEMGGIYFDTDMEIIKDPNEIIKKTCSFLGVEDTGKVCCGVWYEKFPKSYLATKLLEKYRSMKDVDFERRSEFTIPILITEILEKCGFNYKKRSVQLLDNSITVFPRDYFYPYSYNRTNNVFTDNTCMIHYYDASWLPVKNRIENYLVRRYGRKKALKMIKAYQNAMVVSRKTAKGVLFPLVLYKVNKRRKQKITNEYKEQVKKTIEEINSITKASYIVLYNGEWLGVSSATKELFKHTVDCRELYRKQDVKNIALAIKNTNVKQVIFSAMSKGGDALVDELHSLAPDIIIKVYWHGSLSQVLDPYGWGVHEKIIKLCKSGYIRAFATCKKSLYEFYSKNGVNSFFISNIVNARANRKKETRDRIRIGLYAASPTNWRKNMFSQIAAVSLMNNVVLDIVPLNDIALQFGRMIGVEITGTTENLSRDSMIERMSKNDINLYVTFSECSPMVPLESLEVGVPCLTGNNHHYFKGEPLEKYLVVSQEDNPFAIKDKIQLCLNNKEEIIKEYKVFRKKNEKEEKLEMEEFLGYGIE